MLRTKLSAVLLVSVCFAACDRQEHLIVNKQPSASTIAMTSDENKAVLAGDSVGFGEGTTRARELTSSPVPAKAAPAELEKATTAQAANQAFERKIIRNATLEIELDQPEIAQRKAATIAETSGGFVVTSESRNTNGSIYVNVVVRVPAAQFNNVIEQMRAQLGDKAGGKILQDKTSGQDVTEEFVDLEARIKTKKALEEQFLVIMRSASKVSDALEVQAQIAEVRGEIEQMEGRRRLLENQAALSTITLGLHTPAPIVMASGSGFWFQVKQAFADGVDAALEIVLGVIRFVLVLIPVVLLIVLPVGGLLWWLGKRVNWRSKKTATSGVSGNQGESGNGLTGE